MSMLVMIMIMITPIVGNKKNKINLLNQATGAIRADTNDFTALIMALTVKCYTTQAQTTVLNTKPIMQFLHRNFEEKVAMKKKIKDLQICLRTFCCREVKFRKQKSLFACKRKFSAANRVLSNSSVLMFKGNIYIYIYIYIYICPMV